VDQAAALATNVQVRTLLRKRASRAIPEKTGLWSFDDRRSDDEGSRRDHDVRRWVHHRAQ